MFTVVRHFDEIQFVKKIKIRDSEIGNSAPITFYSVVNALLKLPNVDVYVTGSNSTMLSQDVICTELLSLGYEVDVGIVEIFETSTNGSGVRKQIEIDLVANKADRRYYIQSALTIEDPLKRAQEIRPFGKVGDSFKKIILVGGRHEPRRDENGYLVAGVIDFMLSPENVLN